MFCAEIKYFTLGKKIHSRTALYYYHYKFEKKHRVRTLWLYEEFRYCCASQEQQWHFPLAPRYTCIFLPSCNITVEYYLFCSPYTATCENYCVCSCITSLLLFVDLWKKSALGHHKQDTLKLSNYKKEITFTKYKNLSCLSSISIYYKSSILKIPCKVLTYMP